MYFSFALCIFVTAFVFVQCEMVPRRESDSDFTPFHKIACHEVRGSVIKVVNNSTCKPHYRHVPLKSMHMRSFHPTVVSVRRCDGNCPGEACEPTKTEIIKVPVKLKYHDLARGIRDDMCAFVEVEEHTQCGCMCRQKEADCKEYQEYVGKQCACRCKNEQMLTEECAEKVGMFWDEKECMCKCTYMNMECTTGLKWDREKCGCV